MLYLNNNKNQNPYIALFWWDGHCCPMHCDLFKIYCAPLNLGITKTWICRLNFTQRPIFSGLRFYNEPEIWDSGPSRRTCAQDFYVLKKIHQNQPYLNPRTLDLERARYPETTEAEEEEEEIIIRLENRFSEYHSYVLWFVKAQL